MMTKLINWELIQKHMKTDNGYSNKLGIDTKTLKKTDNDYAEELGIFMS